jgi:3-keto steroid reductase
MRQMMVDPVGTVLEPQFILQEIGRKSGDGLRGGVWGVNVLSTYILVSRIVPVGSVLTRTDGCFHQAKELRSHLAKSPVNLPLSPRVIYVTSSQGKASFLPQPPSSDKQLLKLEESYGASKYMGSIVTSHLDAGFSQTEAMPQVNQNPDEDVGKRKVRVLRLDPGVVHTGMFAQWLPFFMEWLMVITLHFVSAPWDVLQKGIGS